MAQPRGRSKYVPDTSRGGLSPTYFPFYHDADGEQLSGRCAAVRARVGDLLGPTLPLCRAEWSQRERRTAVGAYASGGAARESTHQLMDESTREILVSASIEECFAKV